MRIILAALTLGAIVAGGAGVGLAASTQQDKMKTCNATAATKQLTGDARKQFMSSCLSGSAATSATAAKEQTCTSQADGKKLAGAARTSFMKKCVSS